MAVDWTAQLLEQLTFHWDNHVRPRLDGLTDDEYFWEPVEGCWSIRPRAEAAAPIAAGAGDYVAEFEIPEPDPAPFTTIAWRLGHVIVGVLAMRVAGHFGGPPVDYVTHHYAATAREALEQLDDAYAAWTAGVRETDLEAPCGPSEGPYADAPMALLVLHINRELLHHGAEIALLLDLHRARV